MRYFTEARGAVLVVASITLLSCIGPEGANAQGNRNTSELSLGYGFYDPSGYMNAGTLFYASIGHRFLNSTSLVFSFGIGDISTRFFSDHDLFPDERRFEILYVFRLLFKRELLEHSAFSIRPGAGLIYFRERDHRVGSTIIIENGKPVRREFFAETLYSGEAGLLVHATMAYELSNISIGLLSEAHFLYAIGLGGLILSPIVTIEF